MRELFKLSFAILLILFVGISCDDDKEKEPTPPGKKAIEDVINKLEELPDVSDFTEALKKLGTVELDKDEVTVFAVKDEPSVSSQLYAPVSTKAGISTATLKRHVAKGKHDLSKMTGDKLELESIAGDALIVTKEGTTYSINGLELPTVTPYTAGNSIIYIVPEEIPEIIVEPVPADTSYEFLIMELNDDWSPENSDETYPAFETEVIIYRLVNDEYEALDTLLTDKNGELKYTTSLSEELYCKVSKGDKTPFYDSYRYAGLFTSVKEIDESTVVYQTGTDLDIPKPGSLKLVDLNGDGHINADDKAESEYLLISSEYLNDIIIGDYDSSNYETVNWDWLLDRYPSERFARMSEVLYYSYFIDRSLISGEAIYPQLTNLSFSIEKLWHAAYTYIGNVYYYMEVFNSPGCPDIYKRRWEKEFYSSSMVEVAYIYSVLVNYFGRVPLVQTPNIYVKQVDPETIIEYIDHLIYSVDQEDKYAVMAIQARLLLASDSQQDFSRVVVYCQEIKNSGKYDLSADPSTVMDKEILVGPYELPAETVYPVRFIEVLLGSAEAAIELQDNANACEDINKILNYLNKPHVSVADNLRDVVQNLSQELLGNGNMTFMFYKRWNIIEEQLRPYGFNNEINRVLPIPLAAIQANPNLIQNTGY